jgi:molybdopterin/thiamine biosynthesis adenylyltransferase
VKSPDPLIADAPGKSIPSEELRIAKAKAFAEFLQVFGRDAFAALIETRRSERPAGETIVIDVEVERPQSLVHDIRRVERIAVVFRVEDHHQPEILALRADFPLVPHVFVAEQEVPRKLCIYDQPFENEKLTWTPARFIKRIRYWLAQTATGKLHGDDQPLEPLLAGSAVRLILPSDLAVSDIAQKAGLLDIFRIDSAKETGLTLTARWHDNKNPPQVHSVAAVFSCKPQPHGVMRQQPINLYALCGICDRAGLNLAAELASKIREWYLQKPAPTVLQSKLVIILLLPKTRQEGAIIETVEQWAFLTLQDSVQDVGVALDVIQKSGGIPGYVIGQPTADERKLQAISIAGVEIIQALSPRRAAQMNGVEPLEKKILAIGMGALGSQIFNNLIRSGFGRWTLVDNDIFLPHNAARHFLGEWAVGHSKVQAMAAAANAIFESGTVAEAIHADILAPADHEEQLTNAYHAAELVFDFSASLAVGRHLAANDQKARAITAFLTPSGKSLVLLAEDIAREYRLDWLEMLHYRAVLDDPALQKSFEAPDTRFRYGNSCRDVATTLAQDDAAIWAGIASRAIKTIVLTDSAALQVYVSKPTAEVALLEPKIAPLIVVRWFDWQIQFDRAVLEKLAEIRKSKLPNETGGILLGSFDTHRKVCSIIKVVPSPKDSSEWPTSYIRGSAGLQAIVEGAESSTLGQISYVGEWHSHPDRCDVLPSKDDLQAYEWLTSYMHAEGLPSIMLIIGERRKFCIVSDEPA